MKTLATSAGALALAAGILAAQAQTPAIRPGQSGSAQPASSSKQADRPAPPYKGPRVAKDTKALGQKMLKESKPSDTRLPVRPSTIK